MLVPDSEITNVSLYVRSDLENKRLGSVKIKNYNIIRNGLPYPGGIYDSRMGTTSVDWNCDTCGNTKTYCPGHAGYYELNYPVQNPLFLNDIIKWLKVICENCGNLVIKDIKKDIPRINILKTYADKSKDKKCIHCGVKQGHPTRDSNDDMIVYLKYGETKKQIFPHQIEKIFDRIPDKLVEKMGKSIISHPRNFIVNTFIIPPNTIRPDIKGVDGGRRSSGNDLTILINKIVQGNEKIPTAIPDNIDPVGDSNWITAIQHVAHLYFALVKGHSVTSTKRGIVSSSNKQLISAAMRLIRKEGRIRTNLLGGRCVNVMRGVISCDITLKIDEVGIPVNKAKIVFVKEHVRSYNYLKMQEIYRNGKNTYPGCAFIKKTGTSHKYAVELLHNRGYRLQIGDVIYRNVMDGDTATFNRQPSLLAISILAHKVVIIPKGDTIRLNVITCPFYNADYDGDEMNLHFASTQSVMCEIRHLASPQRFAASFQYGNALVIGEAQDSIIGTAELTKDNVEFDRFHAMQMFGEVDGFQGNFDKETYKGRDIISQLLLDKKYYINYSRKAAIYDENIAPYVNYHPNDIQVNIERGVVKSGILDKNALGEGKPESIFHVIHDKYGPQAALETSFNIQQIALRFLGYNGYTVGIKDVLLEKEALIEVKKIESGIMESSMLITEELNAGKIKPPINKTTREFYEDKQLNELNASDLMMPIYKYLDFNQNGLSKLVMTKSKGSLPNIRSAVAGIGQITIGGERMTEDFGGRTLPYALQFDPDPTSYGWVRGSYTTGISPKAFMFNAMDARVSLIGIALGTSVSGEQNRKGIKNLEDQHINNLRQLSRGDHLLQTVYGGDGVDTRYMKFVPFPTMDIGLNDESFKNKYHTKSFKGFDNANAKKLFDEEFKQLLADRKFYRKLFLQKEEFSGSMYKAGQLMPVNVKRIVNDVAFKYTGGEIDPIACLELINLTCDEFPYLLINDIQKNAKTTIPEYFTSAVKLMQILIRSYLNIASLVEKKIDLKMLNIIVDKIKYDYSKALIDYGFAIGILSAQAVSELMTQHALDSKHRAGLGAEKVKGMTRIKEITGAKPSEKMTFITSELYLKEEYENDILKAREIANHIEVLSFRRFVSKRRLFYDDFTNPQHPDFKDDSVVIKRFLKLNKGVNIPPNISPFTLRFEFDKMTMILKQMNMETIYRKVREEFPLSYPIYTNDNEDTLFMRIYFGADVLGRRIVLNEERMLGIEKRIMQMVVRGIEGIRRATVYKANRSYVKKDGSMGIKTINYIGTIGSNLSELMENEFLDLTRMQSNSIIEMRELFGINVAKKKIINELREQIGVNYKHYLNFAEEMCRTGEVTAIERHGLARREHDKFMLRMAESSPVSVIRDASTHNYNDKLYGISGSLMCGQPPRIGSYYNTFSIDEEFVKSQSKSVSDFLDQL